ncbi:hypothetical protein TNCV_857691 [Trichonephila clavipes]|nr:hypothetical protein TNCV_857691 [Trichonephila clavipes]
MGCQQLASQMTVDMSGLVQRYVNLLSDHLHPSMSCVPSDGRVRFQQNNAPSHRSAVATECLESNLLNFVHSLGHLIPQT